MSTEPKRVDVCAVIDATADVLAVHGFGPTSPLTKKLIESRAAVAELIEAAKALNAAMSEEDADDKGILRAWIDHKEALSRIGGTP